MCCKRLDEIRVDAGRLVVPDHPRHIAEAFTAFDACTRDRRSRVSVQLVVAQQKFASACLMHSSLDRPPG